MMPGNEEYQRVINFIMPKWDSDHVDVEFRNMGILGMQRTGKTTLAITIANDLKRRFSDLVVLYGYWLHQIIPRAREDNVLRGTRHVLIILDDATAFQGVDKATLEKLQRELKFYWRIAHELKKAGVEQYTTKVSMLYLYHSYMMVSKFMRNAHVIAVKSIMPKFQQWEREDVTLRWFSAALLKELTRMRFSNNEDEVLSALNKAITVWFDGHSGVLKYHAVKHPPGDYYDYTFLEDVDEMSKDEKAKCKEYKRLVKTLKKAVARLLAETGLPVKRDRTKYLRVKTNGHWISLGPIADLVFQQDKRGESG